MYFYSSPPTIMIISIVPSKPDKFPVYFSSQSNHGHFTATCKYSLIHRLTIQRRESQGKDLSVSPHPPMPSYPSCLPSTVGWVGGSGHCALNTKFRPICSPRSTFTSNLASNIEPHAILSLEMSPAPSNIYLWVFQILAARGLARNPTTLLMGWWWKIPLNGTTDRGLLAGNMVWIQFNKFCL